MGDADNSGEFVRSTVVRPYLPAKNTRIEERR
jgi:hypothetical protein